MKVILSRKGFDSSCGGQASPILPDGTLLSMPIPSGDKQKYSELLWDGLSYLDIICQLKSKTKLNESSHCHLDPDLRDNTILREKGWKPAFGQTGSSLTELRDNGVKEKDLDKRSIIMVNCVIFLNHQTYMSFMAICKLAV